jgi:PAS domain S-box-containing protein
MAGVWLADSYIDYAWHADDHPGQSFLDVAFLHVDSEELQDRGMTVAAIAVFGLVAAVLARRLEKAEARMEFLNRVLRGIRNVNQLLTRERDLQTVLQQSTIILTETHGCTSAWVMALNDVGDVYASASAGVGESFDDLVKAVREGRPPACWQQALDGPVVRYIENRETECNACIMARHHAGCGAVNVRLEYDGRTYGLLGMAVPPHMWGDEEADGLLRELAGDLAFAIRNLEAERERAENERLIHEQRQTLAAIYNASADLVAMKDASLWYRSANDAFCRFVGRKEADVLGKGDFDVFGPAEAEAARYADRCSLEGGLVDERDMEFRGLSGRRWFHVVRVPMHDADGRITGILVSMRDISARRLAEEEVRQVARFPEEDPSPVLRLGPDGAIRYANRAAAPLLAAWNAHEGEPLPEPWIGHVRVALESGQVQRVDAPCGEKVFALSLVPVPQTDYLNVYAMDVTERVRMEARAEELARFPGENPNPVLRIGPDGVIRYANRAAAPLLEAWNCQEGGVLPKEWLDRARSVLRTGKTERLDAVCGERTFSVTLVPISGTDYLNMYARDVTDLLQAEAQLRQSQKMEAVGRLAGGIAHDFNNQLTVIQGYAGLLLQDLPQDSPLRESVACIHAAALNSARLTSELLTFSRKQLLQPRTVGVNEVVRDMVDPLSRMIGEDIHLVLIPGEELPCVEVDPVFLQQAVMNLVINARDAMPMGGRLTIETAITDLTEEYVVRHPGSRDGRHVVLSVSDNGVGMPPEVLAKIFDPFFTTKPSGKGTGLGLAMVYGFVKQCHGSVYAYSEPGKGTAIKIYLPAVTGDAELPAVPPEALAETGGATIMVVEDDEAVRDFVVRVLREYKYEVLDAAGPSDAVELAHDHGGRIDLLLTDVVMPGRNGPEMAKDVRALHPETAVMYCSGYAENAIVHHGFVDRGARLLTKPFTARALLMMVRQALTEGRRDAEAVGPDGAPADDPPADPPAGDPPAGDPPQP